MDIAQIQIRKLDSSELQPLTKQFIDTQFDTASSLGDFGSHWNKDNNLVSIKSSTYNSSRHLNTICRIEDDLVMSYKDETTLYSIVSLYLSRNQQWIKIASVELSDMDRQMGIPDSFSEVVI